MVYPQSTGVHPSTPDDPAPVADSVTDQTITWAREPCYHEPEQVERIGYRELNYGAVPDGKPLDSAATFREMAIGDVDFVIEPFDLIAELPKFDWPVVIVSGGRDLTTPPAVARRIAALIPQSVLVELPTLGHSLIDIRERAALEIAKAVYAGRMGELPSRAAQLATAPTVMSIRLLSMAIGAAPVTESAVPSAVPRLVRRVAH